MNVAPPILSVRDLSVRFGSLVAVNTFSFDAGVGAITSVIGPNGAGKSTLFNLVSGALHPSSGKSVEMTQSISGILLDLTTRVLKKNPNVTSVAIDYVDPDHWIVGGQSRSEQVRAASISTSRLPTRRTPKPRRLSTSLRHSTRLASCSGTFTRRATFTFKTCELRHTGMVEGLRSTVTTNRNDLPRRVSAQGHRRTARLNQRLNLSIERPATGQPVSAAHVERLCVVESGREQAVSVVSVAELLYGARLSIRPREARSAFDAFIRYLAVLDWTREAAEHYADIRADLKVRGNMIGANDLLIAAQSRSMGAVLVTNNVGEFERVPGLKVENWTL